MILSAGTVVDYMNGYKQIIKDGHIPTKRNRTGRKSPNKGKTYEELYGKEKSIKIKRELAEQKIGDKNPVYRQEVKDKISNTAKNNFKNGNRVLSKNNNAHGGIRKDIGHYVRCGWEANFARILIYENIKYEYENKKIIKDINNKDISYFPDFYLPELNIYFELKANNGNTTKYELFKIQNPNEIIYLIKGEEIKKLSRLYSHKIDNWEGRKYYPESYDRKSTISSETICWNLFIEYIKNR